MELLEIFCGTKSVSNVFKEKGHRVFTIDIDNAFNPDLCIDVMELNVSDIPFKPNVIWASPPCQAFSVASIGRNWKKEGKAYFPISKKAAQGIDMVKKTIQLIKELEPEYWFIENPRGMLRKQTIMRCLPFRYTITYCQYGDTRMKPTDIWTNCKHWIPKPACSPGDNCHTSAPRGSRTGTQGLKDSIERAIIPKELCEEIYTLTQNGCSFDSLERWL